MRFVSFLIISASILVSGCAKPGSQSSNASAAAPTFPADWLGTWSGNATVTLPDGKQPFKTEMTLTIEPLPDGDGVSWAIDYHQEAGVRAYELLPEKAQPGRYQLDEKNGIVIPNALVGDTLYSSFTVGKAQLITRTRRMPNNTLLFEIMTFPAADSATTGNKDGVPAVGARAEVDTKGDATPHARCGVPLRKVICFYSLSFAD